MGFNPLNQVYVFNRLYAIYNGNAKKIGFNPLNQVYVFNIGKKLSELGEINALF